MSLYLNVGGNKVLVNVKLEVLYFWKYFLGPSQHAVSSCSSFLLSCVDNTATIWNMRLRPCKAEQYDKKKLEPIMLGLATLIFYVENKLLSYLSHHYFRFSVIVSDSNHNYTMTLRRILSKEMVVVWWWTFIEYK